MKGGKKKGKFIQKVHVDQPRGQVSHQYITKRPVFFPSTPGQLLYSNPTIVVYTLTPEIPSQRKKKKKTPNSAPYHDSSFLHVEHPPCCTLQRKQPVNQSIVSMSRRIFCSVFTNVQLVQRFIKGLSTTAGRQLTGRLDILAHHGLALEIAANPLP